MKAPLLVHAVAAASVLAVPLVSHAQVAVGVRYGQGEGSAHYNVGEIRGRVRVAGNLYATAAFQMIGGHWACAASPVEAIRCGYDGRSVSVGGAYAAFDSRRAYVAIGGDVGGFIRTGTYSGGQYAGDRHLTASVGVDTEVTVLGPLRVQAGIAHRRIFDGLYERTLGETPHVTSVTAGLSVVLTGRKEG